MSHNCDARDRGTSDGRNSLVADCIGHIKRAGQLPFSFVSLSPGVHPEM